MRSLIVAALLALTLPTASTLAFNICPGGHIGPIDPPDLPEGSVYSTTILTRVPGDEYTAVACNFHGEVYLSGQGTPTSSSAPISIRVEDSAVYEYLIVQLPFPEYFSTIAPFYITVQNNVFQNDAKIGFYFGLPALVDHLPRQPDER